MTRAYILRSIAIVFGGICVVTAAIITAVSVSEDSGNTTDKEKVDELKVTITSPKDGEWVGGKVQIEGTVQNLPSDQYLWVVRRASNGRFRPYKGHATIEGDRFYIEAAAGHNKDGSETGKSKEFILLVGGYRVGEEFAAYHRRAPKTGKWPGIAGFFGGKPVARVTVKRR